MTSHPPLIGVIGAGAWGTALATVAARGDKQAILWSRSPKMASELNATRKHPRLAGSVLPAGIRATAEGRDLKACQMLILASPAQALRGVMEECAPWLPPGNTPIIIAAKGIELGTGKFMTEVLSEVCPQAETYVLSGPSFAADVMLEKPTAVTLAGRTLEAAAELAAILSLPVFRIYSSADRLGVQIGGAVKNVLAIACGIGEGKSLGDSARAALTTRGFSEMMRLGHAMGADPATLTGLSGLGDLILTCSSLQSRNFSFGVAVGRSDPAGARAAARGLTIEGEATAKAVMALARKRAMDLP
ncbi:MAG: NAD(P)H-dependent glycerol-3-phosphate dehydrogenase, partial [Aestuariivirgaceae bacterium]